MPLRNEDEKPTVASLLKIKWAGLRPDLMIYQGPLDHNGHRSWVLEDPVRGSNYRLGHAEAELIFRLSRFPDPDTALKNLHDTTTLRPTVEEVATFVTMLQNESLALLPGDVAVQKELTGPGHTPPFFITKLLQGALFFRIPLLRPDKFLTRTWPYISWITHPFFKWLFLAIGLIGVLRVLPELENYFHTVNYLFTSQGMVVFFISLALLKICHEFAHAYAAKSLGLHVRSMGVFFIVFWPLLYTDTTDVWKIPNRKHRIRVSLAGVYFELVVGAVALCMWSLVPDGIFRSLMFFLSGTSIVSTVFVNLNPFMRFDGYYVLMDLWGIDNLRPRAFAILRYEIRKLLFGWTGLAPEVHPHRRWLILYGCCALMYRIFVMLSIALAVYYLLIPVLGLAVFLMEVVFFLLIPLWLEVRSVIRYRHLIGSKRRLWTTITALAVILVVVICPLPRFERVPCLLIYQETYSLESPGYGALESQWVHEGQKVAAGQVLARINNESLIHEAKTASYDLESVRLRIKNLSSGGEQGAYRSWLMAEEKRLQAVVDKLNEALSQLEITAPTDGWIVAINQDLYPGAFVNQGTWLFTISGKKTCEVKAYVHEQMADQVDSQDTVTAKVRFYDVGFRSLTGVLQDKSLFPVRHLPNESLLDIAGGPMVSIHDSLGRRPRDAWFAFTFKVDRIPEGLPHGMPGWLTMRLPARSLMMDAASFLWKHLSRRGFF